MLITTLTALMIAVTLLWLLSLRLQDASIVDIFWGLGYALVAVIALWIIEDASLPARVMLALAIIWGLRLAIYLGWRNIGKPEDPRYQALRRRHGSRFPLLSLPLVFIFQGLLIWVISLPLQVMAERVSGWTIFVAIAILLWALETNGGLA